MTRAIRLLLLVEAAIFLAAASVHFGFTLGGYEHRRAGTAESVIAAVLLGGLLSSLGHRTNPRTALAVQAFALLGTLVGAFTIAVGVGPRTRPDIVFHAALLALLVWGLWLMRRARLTRPHDDRTPSANHS